MIPQLLPGDILLYTFDPKSAYSWLIRMHTGSKYTHAELYLGFAATLTAKSERGVDYYDYDPKRLGCVMRPIAPFDVTACRAWFEASGEKGKPYGWLELLNFIDYNVDADGMVCSAVSALGARAGGVACFNGLPARRVSPRDFRYSEAFAVAWEAA